MNSHIVYMTNQNSKGYSRGAGQWNNAIIHGFQLKIESEISFKLSPNSAVYFREKLIEIFKCIYLLFIKTIILLSTPAATKFKHSNALVCIVRWNKTSCLLTSVCTKFALWNLISVTVLNTSKWFSAFACRIK